MSDLRSADDLQDAASVLAAVLALPPERRMDAVTVALRTALNLNMFDPRSINQPEDTTT